jgi:hypothetical protein
MSFYLWKNKLLDSPYSKREELVGLILSGKKVLSDENYLFTIIDSKGYSKLEKDDVFLLGAEIVIEALTFKFSENKNLIFKLLEFASKNWSHRDAWFFGNVFLRFETSEKVEFLRAHVKGIEESKDIDFFRFFAMLSRRSDNLLLEEIKQAGRKSENFEIREEATEVED